MAKHPPKGAILKSIVNDKLDIKSALGELIDNAIDANARRVTIEVGPLRAGRSSFLRVEDDGDGCADLIDMVQLGSHTDHKTTMLGRFGIGAKNAMLWLGDISSTASIRSDRGGVQRRLRMPWSEYASDDWEIKDEWLGELPSEGTRGTQITIKPTIRRFPEGRAFDHLCEELGYIYTPAIKNHGVQIQVRRATKGAEPRVLNRWELPKLVDGSAIDVEISVGHRMARVHAGIVAEGEKNPRPGLSYTHGFRVIKSNSAIGCGGMDHSGVCGWVSLDKSWDLTKNKDDISQHLDELADAVFAVLQPLLLRSASRGHELQSAVFCADVKRILDGFVGAEIDSMAVRKKGETRGTITPTGTGSGHGRAKVQKAGNTFAGRAGSRSGGGLRVSFNRTGEPDDFGSCSEGQVVLNLDNPFVAQIKTRDNAEACALAAFLLFFESARAENSSGQRNLKFLSTGELINDIGRALARHPSRDGVSLVDSDKDAAE